MKKKPTKRESKKRIDEYVARQRQRHTDELSARPQGAGTAPSPTPPPTPEEEHQFALDRVRTRAAQRRLGNSPLEQLQWLVRLSQLADQDLVQQLSNPDSSLSMQIALFVKYAPAVVADLNKGDPDRSGFVKEAMPELRDGLDSLADSDGWSLTYRATSELGRTTEQRIRGAFGPLEESYRCDDGPTAFLLAAKELVKLEGARLARCDARECRRLFVRRKRGLFCDKKCAQRERVRLWRTRHAQGTAQRPETIS